MLDTYASLLNDPKRNSGEFNFAFGEKDGKIYMSRVWFNPGVASDGSEIQEPLGAKELSDMGMQVLSADHSHPLHKDKAYWTFSPDDMRAGQKFDGDLHKIRFLNQDKHFMQCLLTPAPDNKLMFYDANYNVPDADYIEGAPRIKELGHFSEEGKFVPNLKERDLLKKLGFAD